MSQEMYRSIPVHKNIHKKRMTLKQKLEILEKLEHNVPVKDLMAEYNVGQSTVYDVKYAKEKLMRAASEQIVDGRFSQVFLQSRRIMHLGWHNKLDAAVFDWYKKMKSCGLETVRGVEIRNAALKFASIMGIENFHASPGWLYRFYHRHGIWHRHYFLDEAPTTSACHANSSLQFGKYVEWFIALVDQNIGV